jgi:hypothetical protein
MGVTIFRKIYDISGQGGIRMMSLINHQTSHEVEYKYRGNVKIRMV